MIGRKFIKQLAVFMMIPLILSLATSAGASGRIDASAAMMVDASTGQVLYAQNVNKKLPVASISKLPTVAVIHGFCLGGGSSAPEEIRHQGVTRRRQACGKA